MSSAVGQTLRKRRKAADGPDAIRVLGTQSGAFVVENADTFGAPWPMEPATLARDYGGDPTPAPTEHELLRAADARAHAETMREYRRTDARPAANIDGLRELVARDGRHRETPEELLDAAAEPEAD